MSDAPFPYGRIHNFSAGPAVLPLSVVEELREQLPNFAGMGVGVMELSHRSKPFLKLMKGAQGRIRRLLNLSDEHTVLFLQGGASLQFLMVAMNLLQGGAADYIDTGVWANKAIKEAKRYGTVVVPFSGKAENYRQVPRDWARTPGAVYTHITTNNTIYGTQLHGLPESEGLLVADMSSDILSREVDTSKIDVIYAGAQKNLGPSGLTVVTLSPRAMARAALSDAPTMLNYKVHADDADQLYNTPNTFGVLALDRVLNWIETQGLQTVGETNRRKAQKIYDLLDSSDFWRPHAAQDSRSDMNITWRLKDEALEPVFVKEATEAGLDGLKGHRSVGGLRASIYNACPEQSVDALVAFMREFERVRG